MAAIDSSAVATSIEWGTVAASVLGSTLLVFLLEFAMGWKRKGEIEIQVARRIAELTRLHEKRLDLISDLGGKLFNLRRAFVEYTAPMRADDQPDFKTSRLSLGKAIEDFDASLQPRRCFIPSPTLAKLEAFREEVRDIAWEFSTHVEFIDDGRSSREFVEKKYQTWEAARAFVMERSKVLLADLHQDFQRILGIVDPPPSVPSSHDGSKSDRG